MQSESGYTCCWSGFGLRNSEGIMIVGFSKRVQWMDRSLLAETLGLCVTVDVSP